MGVIVIKNDFPSIFTTVSITDSLSLLVFIEFVFLLQLTATQKSENQSARGAAPPVVEEAATTVAYVTLKILLRIAL
jgi:hypothetical protein